MMHGPEGEGLTYGDGIQPEDLERITSSATESDPDASKKVIERWEIDEFGDAGNTPINETDRVNIVG